MINVSSMVLPDQPTLVQATFPTHQNVAELKKKKDKNKSGGGNNRNPSSPIDGGPRHDGTKDG